MSDYPFPKVHISAEDRKRYASYTYESIFALKLIQVLPTKFLAQCLDDTNEEHHALCRHIGLITNLCWLTAAVAEELYLTRHVMIGRIGRLPLQPEGYDNKRTVLDSFSAGRLPLQPEGYDNKNCN
jgi:hypothetical protein